MTAKRWCDKCRAYTAHCGHAVGKSDVERVVIQRFKPVLTTGNWPDNPEPLVRDALGEYVKITDVIELIEKAHMAGQWDAGVDPSYSNALAYRQSKLAV